MKHGSDRIKSVIESATLVVSEKARQLAQQGHDVIDLGGGDPDFPTPAHITRAAFEAVDKGATHYVSSRGIPPLLSAIAEKYAREQHLEYDPKTEVMVTPGGKLGIYAAILGTVDRGDEVLLPEPAWVSYVPMIMLADGLPASVTLASQDNFRITREVLEEKVTARTRLILINSPNNPTGRVFTREELTAIAEVALAHDLLVISDEIYEKLVFDDHQHVSIATLPGMRERTIIVNGLSKSHAMTGWRLGFALAPRSIMAEVLKVQMHTATCAAAFTQVAATEALTASQNCVTEMVDVYRQRRQILINGLNSLPGVHCVAPEGAFYAFPNITGTGMTSEEYATRMLEEAKVAMTPGGAFGQAGEGHVRLSFANATEKLEQAIERIGKVL